MQKYNDLYDPLKGVSTCLTGQLLLTQLIIELSLRVDGMQLIQSNTDGIMLSLPRESLGKTRDIITKWSEMTYLTMEEEQIDRVIQKDVNNYIVQKANGDIKNIGGYVANYPSGTFDSNSLSITHKAIVEYFINDKPVEDTINECNDIFQFQLIAKTGSTYDKAVHYINGKEVQVQKVNRLYAVKDSSLGVVKKVKRVPLLLDGKRRYYITQKGTRSYKKNHDGEYFIKKDTVQNCPPHAMIDNTCKITIDTIDKSWYIDIAIRRINEFIGIKPKEKKMTTTKKELEPRVALLQKIFKVGEVLAKRPWIMDGYNSHQSYEYVTSDKYREELGNACREVGLIFKMNVANRAFEVLEGSKMNLTTVVGTMCFIDPNTGEHEDYSVMGDGTDNLDKGIYKAETLMVKYFVLNNFLLPKQQDEIDPESGKGEKKVEEKKVKTVKIATPEERENAKTSIVDDNYATESTIKEMVGIMDKIREVKKGYGESTYINLQDVLKGEKKLAKTEAVKMMSKFEERMDEFGIE